MLIYVTSAYSDSEPVQSFLDLARHGIRHRLTRDLHGADAILFVENSRYHEDAFFSRLKRHPFLQQHRDRCFMYNEHDHPWYLLPGVYCSMQMKWFDPKRQRATRYIRLLNPVDTSPSDQPDLLFSFLGNAQITLRKRILKLKHPRAILEDTSSFSPFLAKEHSSKHSRYADVLRRSKFVLCPRGCGSSSIRLFETLRAGRVPIVISDQWVAPEGPDWTSCSLRVRERNIAEIEHIALETEPLWPVMATAAKHVWNKWFADEVLFDRIGDALAAIKKEREFSDCATELIPAIPEWDWRLRRAVHYGRRYFSS